MYAIFSKDGKRITEKGIRIYSSSFQRGITTLHITLTAVMIKPLHQLIEAVCYPTTYIDARFDVKHTREKSGTTITCRENIISITNVIDYVLMNGFVYLDINVHREGIKFIFSNTLDGSGESIEFYLNASWIELLCREWDNGE